MMLSAHAGGHLAVTQPAHAWLSGQLARAWGNERFGAVQPREEVCLGAEQHDIGMAAWDLSPTLDPGTGLPTTFTAMDVETHLRLWSEGPELLLSQSRYAALLVSLHGSSLYAGRDLSSFTSDQRRRVVSFLARRRAFEVGLCETLAVAPAEVTRNQRLVATWDGLSLALILGWAPWTADDVPSSTQEPLAVSVRRQDAHHVVSPWPFGESRVVVRSEGRLLDGVYAEQHELDRALGRASWIELVYELRPS